MFPSRTPILYLIQVIGVYLVILGCLALGAFLAQPLAQPLAIMSLFALQWVPQVPLIPETPEDEQAVDTGNYDGVQDTSEKFGFGRAQE